MSSLATRVWRMFLAYADDIAQADAPEDRSLVFVHGGNYTPKDNVALATWLSGMTGKVGHLYFPSHRGGVFTERDTSGFPSEGASQLFDILALHPWGGPIASHNIQVTACGCASNTLEEVQSGIDAARQPWRLFGGDFATAQRIYVYCVAAQAPRADMTWKRHCPPDLPYRMLRPAASGRCGPKTLPRLIAECQRLVTYSRKGDIACLRGADYALVEEFLASSEAVS